MVHVLIPLVTLMVGGLDDDAAAKLEAANNAAVTTAQQQLIAVAQSRGVRLLPDQVSYVTVGTAFIVHGAPADSGTHTEGDFAKGVDISFIYIGGVDRVVPRGFYTVHAIIPLGATEGQAQFLDGKGQVVSVQPLYIRTDDQEVTFLPNPVDPGPSYIPNITSTHVWRNGKWYVDCSGWQPYHTIYYPM